MLLTAPSAFSLLSAPVDTQEEGPVLLHRRYGFKISVEQKVKTAAGNTWTAVTGVTGWVPKSFVALSVDSADITAETTAGFITYSKGNGRYSVLTPSTIAGKTLNYFRATVKAVYVDGTESAESFISTISTDLVPVSSIALVSGDAGATPAEGLLLSFAGHDNTESRL
jgi:hypothetical protein